MDKGAGNREWRGTKVTWIERGRGDGTLTLGSQSDKSELDVLTLLDANGIGRFGQLLNGEPFLCHGHQRWSGRHVVRPIRQDGLRVLYIEHRSERSEPSIQEPVCENVVKIEIVVGDDGWRHSVQRMQLEIVLEWSHVRWEDEVGA